MDDEQLKAAIEKVLTDRSKSGAGASSGDPRPADIDVFFSLLPTIIGGYAGKSTDSRSALALAFVMTREAVGQCCMMGVARVATICTDGSHLAVMPQQANVPGVQGAITANQDPTQRGVVVAQYPNSQAGMQPAGIQQPGPGGMVAQYPTNQSNGGVVQHAGGGGLGTPTGNGMRAVVVAMVPNDPNLHPIAQPQAPQFPQQQGQR